MVAVHWSFVADGMIYREQHSKLRLVMVPGKLGLKFYYEMHLPRSS